MPNKISVCCAGRAQSLTQNILQKENNNNNTIKRCVIDGFKIKEKQSYLQTCELF